MTDSQRPLIVTHDTQDYLVSDADWERLESGIFVPRICEHCGCKCRGMEPLYPMETAAALVPFPNAVAMRQWLHFHKKEVGRPLYRKFRGHRIRMISATLICKIRDILINPYSPSPSPKDPTLRALRKANAFDDEQKSELIVQAIERKANA